jgi:hypothetical protein
MRSFVPKLRNANIVKRNHVRKRARQIAHPQILLWLLKLATALTSGAPQLSSWGVILSVEYAALYVPIDIV